MFLSLENNSREIIAKIIDEAIWDRMVYKYNFENATEKREADRVMGHILMPDPDGQEKHPEHLQQHEMLQVLQRESLNENWPVVRKMISELPEHQKPDTIEMLKRANEELAKPFPGDIL